MSSLKSMKNGNKKIFVSNIPYEFKLDELEELFNKEVGDVLSVVYYKDSKDIFLGCITVEFIRVGSAQMAIGKMNDFEINGNKLIVKEDNIERDKSGYPLSKVFHTNIISDEHEFTVPKISTLNDMNQGETNNSLGDWSDNNSYYINTKHEDTKSINSSLHLSSLIGEENDSFSSITLDTPKSSKWWRKITCCLN